MANTVAVGVGDIETPERINGNALGMGNESRGGRSAVADQI